MRNFVLLISGFAAGAFSTALYQYSSSTSNAASQQPALAHHSIEDARTIQTLLDKIATLEQALATAHSPSKNVSVAQAQTQQYEPTPPPATQEFKLEPDKHAVDADMYAALIREKQRAFDQHLIHVQQSAANTPQEALAGEFAQEEYDQSKTDSLHTTLAEMPELPNSAIVETECRRSRCKLSILDDDNVHSSANMLYQSLESQEQLGDYTVAYNEETGITDIYFERTDTASKSTNSSY